MMNTTQGNISLSDHLLLHKPNVFNMTSSLLLQRTPAKVANRDYSFESDSGISASPIYRSSKPPPSPLKSRSVSSSPILFKSQRYQAPSPVRSTRGPSDSLLSPIRIANKSARDDYLISPVRSLSRPSSRGPVDYSGEFEGSRLLDSSLDYRDINEYPMKAMNKSFECVITPVKCSTPDFTAIKEWECKKTVAQLERKQNDYHDLYLETLKVREKMQERIEALDLEVNSLRAQNKCLQSECQKSHLQMSQVTAEKSALELHHQTQVKMKEKLSQELCKSKDNVELARNRSVWLETHGRDYRMECERLKQECDMLRAQNLAVNKQSLELKASNQLLKEEASNLVVNLASVKEGRYKNERQIATLENTLTDLQSTLQRVNTDKDRLFKNKLDLHQKMDDTAMDRERMLQVHAALEDQISDLHTELLKARSKTDKTKSSNRSMEEEINSVRKAGEVLSSKLASSQGQIEKLQLENAALTQTQQVSAKQKSLYELEINNLQSQLDGAKKSLEVVKKESFKEKTTLSRNIFNCKDEIRHVHDEKNKLESKINQLEKRVSMSQVHVRDRADFERREIDSWRSNCERLGASLANKDLEIKALTQKMQHAQKQLVTYKRGQSLQRGLYNDSLCSTEEIARLRCDNETLLRDRGENSHLIQTLERENNSLQQNVNHRDQGSDDRNHMNALTVENISLREKVKEIEEIRDKLIREKEMRLVSGEWSPGNSIIEDKKVPSEINEKVNRLEQENYALIAKLTECVSKTEYKKLQSQNDTLEDELSRMQHNYQTICESPRMSETTTMTMETECNFCRRDKQGLAVMVENEKGRTDDALKQKEEAEEKMRELEQEIYMLRNNKINRSGNRDEEIAKLNKKAKELTSQLLELQTINVDQEIMIQSMKDELEDGQSTEPSQFRESLDDVGSDLTQMKAELQKLLGVIQVKDQTIGSLETQLHTARSGTKGSVDCSKDGSIMNDKLACLEREKIELEDKVAALEKSFDLNASLADTEDGVDGDVDDRFGVIRKLRRDVASKDRMIENLEAQLRGANQSEIQKWKRDASRIELLRSENQVLKNRLTPTSSKFLAANDKNDFWSESRRRKPSNIFGKNSTIHQQPFGRKSQTKMSSEEEIHDNDDSDSDSDNDKTLSNTDSDYDHDTMEKDVNTKEPHHILKNVSNTSHNTNVRSAVMDQPNDTTVAMAAEAEDNIDNILERRRARLGQTSPTRKLWSDSSDSTEH